MEEFVQLKNKLWSVLLAVGGPLALGRGAIRQDDITGYNGGPSLVQCNCDTNKFYTDVFCQRPEVIYQETIWLK